MTLKEEFLSINTWEELKPNIEKYKKLGTNDKEVMQHLSKLMGTAWAPDEYHMDAKLP